nr:hypothetical protein [Palleronia marisminoris]
MRVGEKQPVGVEAALFRFFLSGALPSWCAHLTRYPCILFPNKIAAPAQPDIIDLKTLAHELGERNLQRVEEATITGWPKEPMDYVGEIIRLWATPGYPVQSAGQQLCPQL